MRKPFFFENETREREKKNVRSSKCDRCAKKKIAWDLKRVDEKRMVKVGHNLMGIRCNVRKHIPKQWHVSLAVRGRSTGHRTLCSVFKRYKTQFVKLLIKFEHFSRPIEVARLYLNEV